jgi:hypothetical protein
MVGLPVLVEVILLLFRHNIFLMTLSKIMLLETCQQVLESTNSLNFNWFDDNHKANVFGKIYIGLHMNIYEAA